MHNQFLKISIKISSLVGSLFLILGTIMTVGSGLGYIQTGMLGMLTLSVSAVVVLFCVAFYAYDYSNTDRALKDAVEIAHQLAQGDFYEDEPYNPLTESLKEASEFYRDHAMRFDRIAAGSIDSEYTPVSDADMFGRSVFEMLKQLRNNMQSRETRIELDNSVQKLVQEISDAASGNLSAEADVRNDLTGSIADSFNIMMRKLSLLMKQIKNASYQIGASSNLVNDTADQLERGSVAQSSQVTRTASAVSAMSNEISVAAVKSTKAAEVASQSLSNARSGTKAAQDSVGAMNSIRNQIQETAKRIKKVGERSQEMSQIVSLVDDLSERTSLLALNTTLQLSSDSGTNKLNLVVDEVEGLADRSNKINQQISDLTRTIQSETKDLVASMEDTIHQVTIGSKYAEKAATALLEIETVSAKLDELLKVVSETTRFQAKNTEDISHAMAGIAEVTEIVKIGSGRNAESIRSLVSLSDELNSTLSIFKLSNDLPATPQRQTTSLNKFIN